MPMCDETHSANSIGQYKTDRDYFLESSCTLVKTNMALSIIIILSQNFMTIHFFSKSVETQMLSNRVSLSDPSFSVQLFSYLKNQISKTYENKVLGNGVR